MCRSFVSKNLLILVPVIRIIFQFILSLSLTERKNLSWQSTPQNGCMMWHSFFLLSFFLFSLVSFTIKFKLLFLWIGPIIKGRMPLDMQMSKTISKMIFIGKRWIDGRRAFFPFEKGEREKKVYLSWRSYGNRPKEYFNIHSVRYS